MSQAVDKSKLYKSLGITPNRDGTFTRSSEFFPTTPPSTDPTLPALSRDIPINSEKNTWARIFLPRSTPSSTKLPVLVYIHGGGFVLCSPDFTPFHEFCSFAACHLGALVVSVKYRLAPEHRLPAAYDDVYETLRWIKDGGDEWVREFGDLSKCVLMGESAGGNISYHVGLKVACEIVSRKDFGSLVINGLVLVQPFFGGLDRTGSEIRSDSVPDPFPALEICDFLWELSLPDGADRGHEYCDPMKGGGMSLVDNVRDLGMWVMVIGCDGDPFFDKGVEFARLLEGKGVNVKTLFSEGGQHGMFIGPKDGDFSKRLVLLDFVKEVWP